jgi:ubiquinone/menaquinone biosynthesis C-methylase UbiE
VPESLGLVFDRVAAEYDRVRPAYPASLVDGACSIGDLRPGSRVVEVGCGSGKLTAALVERGLRVDAVDPGRELVEIARRRLPTAQVRFHVARFEDAELPESSFEALFSATAFHWVTPDVAWTKAARVLRPGGLVAVLTHIGAWTELDEDLLGAWREVLPEAANWVARDPEAVFEGADARRENVSDVLGWLTKREIARPEAAQLFGEVRVATVPIEREPSAEELLALLRTTSGFLRLDPLRQDRLGKRLAALVAGDRPRPRTFAVLVTARARSG